VILGFVLKNYHGGTEGGERFLDEEGWHRQDAKDTKVKKK
jgi:hypothetical protein